MELSLYAYHVTYLKIALGKDSIGNIFVNSQIFDLIESSRIYSTLSWSKSCFYAIQAIEDLILQNLGFAYKWHTEKLQ